MNRVIWFLVFLAGSACSASKSGSTTGPTATPTPSDSPATVTIGIMTVDRTPLSGVSISLLSGSGVVMSGVTDPSGHAVFSNVPQGSYRLQAKASGFADLDQPLVVQGTSVSANTTMTRADAGNDVTFDQIVSDTQGVLSPTGATLRGYPETLRLRGHANIVGPLPANGALFLGFQFQVGDMVVSIGNQVSGGSNLFSSGAWEKVFVITGRPFTTMTIGGGPPITTYYGRTDTISLTMQNGPHKLIPFVLNYP